MESAPNTAGVWGTPFPRGEGQGPRQERESRGHASVPAEYRHRPQGVRSSTWTTRVEAHAPG